MPHETASVGQVSDSATRPASASIATQSNTPGASSAPLIEFLESRATTFQTSEGEGQAWLEATTVQLRQALITRGLPAKLVEGMAPILTPNAAIIKLQGSKDLTVQAVESRVDEIFTSDGVKIINTTPESGRVSIAVERPNRQVLHTEPVLLSYLRSYSQKTHGEKFCVGIREEDGEPLLLDPFNQPHTLTAGITGSGKSVLMQNLILSIAATRSPEERMFILSTQSMGWIIARSTSCLTSKLDQAASLMIRRRPCRFLAA
jgi:DNA segregation ATPase FtsK/SpoIIIE, S-DNA-T family